MFDKSKCFCNFTFLSVTFTVTHSSLHAHIFEHSTLVKKLFTVVAVSYVSTLPVFTLGSSKIPSSFLGNLAFSQDIFGNLEFFHCIFNCPTFSCQSQQSFFSFHDGTESFSFIVTTNLSKSLHFKQST